MVKAVKLTEVMFKLELSKSISDSKRLIKSGAVEVNGKKITDINYTLLFKVEGGENENCID